MMEVDESMAIGPDGIQVEREKCCAKCRYFEDRTCFCRFNPPIPVVTVAKNGQQFVTSVYSKINMPSIDWCQKFDKRS